MINRYKKITDRTTIEIINPVSVNLPKFWLGLEIILMELIVIRVIIKAKTKSEVFNIQISELKINKPNKIKIKAIPTKPKIKANFQYSFPTKNLTF